jgi:urea carboxylase-associated protein 2
MSVEAAVTVAPLLKITLDPGAKWSGRIGRNRKLVFITQEAGANVAALFYAAWDRVERYNMPDTLKAQHTQKLTRGHCLFSDMGRVLCSLVGDTAEWHDGVGGLTSRSMTDARWGQTSFQKQRNAWLRSGYENVLVELEKFGMGKKDLVPGVNLFSKVVADEEGNVALVPNHAPPGSVVALRTDMDVIAVFSNTPHPLDLKKSYPSVPVTLEIWPCDPADSNDYCRNFRPENGRAFENTEEFHRLLG